MKLGDEPWLYSIEDRVETIRKLYKDNLPYGFIKVLKNKIDPEIMHDILTRAGIEWVDQASAFIVEGESDAALLNLLYSNGEKAKDKNGSFVGFLYQVDIFFAIVRLEK